MGNVIKWAALILIVMTVFWRSPYLFVLVCIVYGIMIHAAAEKFDKK